jgi:hypothetical protein
MKIIMSRKDIKEQSRLLVLLETWEQHRGIAGHHNLGTVSVTTRGCKSEIHKIDTRVDPATHDSDEVDQAIRLICAKHVNAMVEEVIRSIKSRLPINEEE